MDKTFKKLKSINYIMKYMWITEKRYILFRIPEIILKSIQPFVMVIFPKIIIDQLLYSESEYLFNDILKIICIMVGINLLIKGALVFLNTCLTNAYNSFDSKHVINIGKKIMSLEYKNVEDSRILDIFQRAKNTNYCEDMYSAIAGLIANAITCIGLFAILAQLKLVVILLILVVVVINVMCNKRTQQYDYQWYVDATPYRRVQDYLLGVMHGFQYGKEVRIYKLEEYISKKYARFSNKFLRSLFKVTIKFLKLNMVTTVVNLIQEGLLYVYLAYKVIVDHLTIGNFTMLLNSVQKLTECLIGISANVVSIGRSVQYIDELYYIMHLEERNQSNNVSLPDLSAFVIEFENVSFQYPGCDQYVLKNINTKIYANQKVSIVGTNGSGKTTFIKLILRLYQPTEGKIKLNGIDIQDIDYESYMKSFAAVFQDYKIFAYSINENIAMDEEYDSELIDLVISKLNMQKMMDKLPKGKDTVMYKFLNEDGIELSGGEQQKLVIARALYKQTPILILDEPTAALDPLMEYEIYRCINEEISDKCILFISHRLSITKYCDDVLVFNQGNIVQQGTHEQLMKDESGIYYEMYTCQAEFYEDQKQK